MQLHLIESDKIYKEILETPIEKRDEVFCWSCHCFTLYEVSSHKKTGSGSRNTML